MNGEKNNWTSVDYFCLLQTVIEATDEGVAQRFHCWPINFYS